MAGREKTAARWIAESDERDEIVVVYERSDSLREGYGMQVAGVTREDLQALLDGKVLVCNVLSEYSLLLYLKESRGGEAGE